MEHDSPCAAHASQKHALELDVHVAGRSFWSSVWQTRPEQQLWVVPVPQAPETLEQVTGASQMPSLQMSPAGLLASYLQQSVSVEQVPPVGLQTTFVVAHVPALAPSGTSHVSGEQQSPATVQEAPDALHGVLHFSVDASHRPEQQSEFVLQVRSLATQVGHLPPVHALPLQQGAAPPVEEHVPPFGTHAVEPFAQTNPAPSTARQAMSFAVPGQQLVSLAPSQRVPSALHPPQRRMPDASGTHGASPQH